MHKADDCRCQVARMRMEGEGRRNSSNEVAIASCRYHDGKIVRESRNKNLAVTSDVWNLEGVKVLMFCVALARKTRHELVFCCFDCGQNRVFKKNQKVSWNG